MQDFEQVNGKLAKGHYPTKSNEIVVGYHFAQTLLNETERNLIAEKSKRLKQRALTMMAVKKAIRNH